MLACVEPCCPREMERTVLVALSDDRSEKPHTRRAVSFKNFEAATYQSYAQASALVANRESAADASCPHQSHGTPAYLSRVTMVTHDGILQCPCRTVCMAADAPGWSRARVLGPSHQLLHPEFPGRQSAKNGRAIPCDPLHPRLACLQ